MTDWPVLPNL